MCIRTFFKRIITLDRHNSDGRTKGLEEANRAIKETAERLARLEASLLKASAGYRRLLIEKNPDILPELIRGNNPEEMDLALEAARELTVRIKERLSEQERGNSRRPARPPGLRRTWTPSLRGKRSGRVWDGGESALHFSLLNPSFQRRLESRHILSRYAGDLSIVMLEASKGYLNFAGSEH